MLGCSCVSFSTLLPSRFTHGSTSIPHDLPYAHTQLLAFLHTPALQFLENILNQTKNCDRYHSFVPPSRFAFLLVHQRSMNLQRCSSPLTRNGCPSAGDHMDDTAFPPFERFCRRSCMRTGFPLSQASE